MQNEFNDIKYSLGKSAIISYTYLDKNIRIADQLRDMEAKEAQTNSKVNEMNQTIFELTSKCDQFSNKNDVQIAELRSLKNILKQKDTIIEDIGKDREVKYSEVNKLIDNIQKLGSDNEKLISDNTKIIGQNEQLKSQVLEAQDEIKMIKLQFNEERLKDKEYIHYLELSQKNKNDIHTPENYNVMHADSNDKEFHQVSNKTADFALDHYDKENTSLNSIRNIGFNDTRQDYNNIGSFVSGKIAKNRSISRTDR